MRSRNHCYFRKTIITNCDCVSIALVIQHEMRMRHVMFLCDQSGYNIFSTLSYKRQYFRKIYRIKNSILIFSSNLCKTFFILRRIEREIVTNAHTSSCKIPIFLVRIYSKLNFLDKFSKKYSISNFVKIFSVGAELFQANGQTDKQA
jgi:hypothetical protein